MEDKLVFVTSAKNVVVPDPNLTGDESYYAIPGFRFVEKLYLFLNKKKTPQTPEDWGFVLEL